METINGFITRVIIFLLLFFLVFGGWKIIGWVMLMIIGHIMGLPIYGIRVLIRKVFDYDFMMDSVEFYEGAGEGMFIHSAMCLLSIALAEIIYFIILVGVILVELVISSYLLVLKFIVIIVLALLMGYGTYFLISKLTKNKHKSNVFLAAILGGIVLAVFCLIVYSVYIIF